MAKKYFTVGPSELYPTVEVHLRQALMEDVPSMSHRGDGFKNLYKRLDRNLRKLMGIPKSHHIFFVGSALEGIERTIQNTVGRASFHFVSGAFSQKAYDMADMLGKQTEAAQVKEGKGFDLEDMDIPRRAELIFITENDTSTGVRFPMEDITLLKDRYPAKLLAIDVVSSVPYTKIDFGAVDVAIFSVQKGFGLPAGLGIIIASDAAIEKAKMLEQRSSIGSYHSFLSLHKSAEQWQTPETPNVLDIYLLEKVTEEMVYTGIKTIRKETEEKAKKLYKLFDIHPKYRPFVDDETIRSFTTLVIDVDNEGELVREKLTEEGIIVGSGYGNKKNAQIRIGNFPAHTALDVQRLLQGIKHIS